MIRNKPFLKWAGNKYHCIAQLKAIFPKAPRLIEPFVGSAAVFLNFGYQEALLAEQNSDLITLFTCLQQEGTMFIDDCEVLFTPINNNESKYYELRANFNACTQPRERAILFLYLNRHGYNGLCRYNQNGGYNVPFGRYIKPYFPRTEMLFFCQQSQNATFIVSDFRETFSKALSGDLIYCDPPYAPLSQSSNFTAYTAHKFGLNDQIILAEYAKKAANNGATVIISNHDTPDTRKMYTGATIYSFQVKRYISCHAMQRVAANELLAIFRPT